MSDEPQHSETEGSSPLCGTQIGRVYEALKSGVWLTLPELHELTGDPVSSISAQIRHLKRPEHGGHKFEKRRRGQARAGLFEYRLCDGAIPE